MAESILKIHTQNGDIPVGYPGLADKPVSDETLSIQGGFADAKAVGDKFKEVKTETDSLKEDLGDFICYPFSNKITNKKIFNKGIIEDITIYGGDNNKEYVLAVIRQDQICIYERNGDGFGSLACIKNMPKKYNTHKGIETLHLVSAYNGKVEAYIKINWDKYTEGYTGLNWELTLISKKCYSNKLIESNVVRATFTDDWNQDFLPQSH